MWALVSEFSKVWVSGRVVGDINPDNIPAHESGRVVVIDDVSWVNEFELNTEYNYNDTGSNNHIPIQRDIYAFSKAIMELLAACGQTNTTTYRYLLGIRSKDFSRQLGNYKKFLSELTDTCKTSRDTNRVDPSMHLDYIRLNNLVLLPSELSVVTINQSDFVLPVALSGHFNTGKLSNLMVSYVPTSVQELAIKQMTIHYKRFA